MKEIVILSGKGGVGKSSIAASLGRILSKRCRLVLSDTDVDAPNLNLVLGASLTDSREITASEKAFIDYDKCNGCMACLDACRFSSMTGAAEPVVITYSCEGCGACALTCPEGAIEIREVTNGRLNTYTGGGMPVIAGELDIGESSSGRLVDTVRTAARKQAEDCRADIILTDGPPGIGCPVISSVKGADYALAVTEPTPAALSDLKRVVAVIERFKIPLGIVINRSGMHEKSLGAIKAFAEEEGYKVLSEIPYDKSVAMALALSRPVVDAYPEAPSSAAIARLAEKLMEVCACSETSGDYG